MLLLLQVDQKTADLVRFAYSVQRSMVKAYEHGAAGGAAGFKTPWGQGPWRVPDAAMLELLPFRELFEGLLSHAKAMPESAFEKAKFLSKKPKAEVLALPACADLLAFTRSKVMPQRDLLFPYYIIAQGDEAQLYEPMLPAKIIEQCPVRDRYALHER